MSALCQELPGPFARRSQWVGAVGTYRYLKPSPFGGRQVESLDMESH
jgi:hypothetical protein